MLALWRQSGYGRLPGPAYRPPKDEDHALLYLFANMSLRGGSHVIRNRFAPLRFLRAICCFRKQYPILDLNKPLSLRQSHTAHNETLSFTFITQKHAMQCKL